MTTQGEYYSIADTVVGEMIEGQYGWNEWCPEHAAHHLARGTSVGVNHRTVTIHEATTSWREYKCYQCQKTLWSKGQADVATDVRDPFPKPSGGSIVKDSYSM